MSVQKPLTIGSVLEDRYCLVSEVSPRDIGSAYRAYDLQEDQLVDLVVVDASWGSGQEALNRLRLVEQAITELASPSLLPHEYAGLVDEQVYLVYPHTGGQTLADLLARDGRLDEEAAVATTIRLCEALAPVHHAGLTHGSLSPHCIVLREMAASERRSAPQILVLDAALLPALRPTDPTPHETWGRLPYISPEQASGRGVQPPSDVYVIGAMLYEMLIGRPPFRATDEVVLAWQHLHQEPPSLQLMDTGISQPLAQIVYRTLAKEPSARYRNAGQLAHILRARLGAQPEPVRPSRQEHLVVPPPPAPAISKRRASPTLNNAEGARHQAPEGIDWVMITLLVAALIAVLGLIPLWHAVYTRYAGTSAGSSSLPRPQEAEPVPILLGNRHQGNQSARGTELGESTVVWYNVVPASSSPDHRCAAGMHARERSGWRESSPSLGVQLTGRGGKV